MIYNAPGPSPAAVGLGGGKIGQGRTVWQTNDVYASVATSCVTSVCGGDKAPAADSGANAVTTVNIDGGRGNGKASDDGDANNTYGTDVDANVAVTGSHGNAKSDNKDIGGAGDGADTVTTGCRSGNTSNDKDTPVVNAPGGNKLP